MLSKPYYRIYRPNSNSDGDKYLLNSKYSEDRIMLCRAYNLIEKDMISIFEYIEPSDSNEEAYSHRIYELYLRAATEFETNCKKILNANGYSSANNITDYFKINNAMKLSEYKVILGIWQPSVKYIEPFLEWNSGHSLSWYQDYNYAKHDRQNNFMKANLANLIKAVASVYCILFSQFSVHIFNQYQANTMYNTYEDGSFSSDDSLFRIIPASWNDDEKYSFNWDTLKTTLDPIVKFSF